MDLVFPAFLILNCAIGTLYFLYKGFTRDHSDLFIAAWWGFCTYVIFAMFFGDPVASKYLPVNLDDEERHALVVKLNEQSENLNTQTQEFKELMLSYGIKINAYHEFMLLMDGDWQDALQDYDEKMDKALSQEKLKAVFKE